MLTIVIYNIDNIDDHDHHDHHDHHRCWWRFWCRFCWRLWCWARPAGQPCHWQIPRWNSHLSGSLCVAVSTLGARLRLVDHTGLVLPTILEQYVVAVVIVIPSLQVSTSPNIQYDASTSGDRLNIWSSQFLNLASWKAVGPSLEWYGSTVLWFSLSWWQSDPLGPEARLQKWQRYIFIGSASIFCRQGWPSVWSLLLRRHIAPIKTL